jgi:TIR domain
MTRYWRHAALALAAVIAAFVWPLTPALPSGIVLTARLASAVAAVLVCGALATWSGAGRRATIGIAAAGAAIGLGMLLTYVNAQATCIVEYFGRPVVIGTVLLETPDTETYLKRNPKSASVERIEDAGGVADRIWTADSIRSCTRLVAWPGVGAIPFLAASAAVLMRRRSYVLPARAPQASPPAAAPAAPPVYDAFISYRHLEPDRMIALDLVESLERAGLRMAIDARDFLPNEHFLSEMERCIRQSRFVLCVITSQFVQSDHTSEEAIISKTLDLAERRRRLVPLIFERVELPVWLHGLVGIDFTPAASVDPRERLEQLLKRREA